MGADSARLSRRSFLRTTTLGVAAAGMGVPLLTSCGGGSNVAATGTANSKTGLAAALPDYVPFTGGPTADLPIIDGINGASTDPGYLTYPTDLAKTVAEVPGSGGSYTAITPLWGAIPAADNPYYQAVNTALGATVTVKPADGNNYAQTVPTLVAGNKLPDWIQLPTWWNGNLNVGELAVAKFADLTPYLAGDKVRAYPNLAAIPTGGWQAGAWNNSLYGIPSFTTGAAFAGALFYRGDVFDAKGIDPAAIDDAEALYALGKELTAAKANVWAFDVLWLMIQPMFKVPPLGAAVTVIDGKVTSAFEAPQVEAALEFAHKLAKSGYVHPDALADNSDGKQRFYSGKVLVCSDGTGAWNGQDAVAGTAANPDYVRAAFQPFSHDGSEPSIPLGSSASMMSYLNKELSAEQIQECLAIADYLAAPYGSAEYTLVNYGVEGVHWERGDTGPTYTTQGTKEANQTTYQFLCTPRSAVTNPGYERVTKDFSAWATLAVQFAYKPPFWNLNVNTPSRFASISTATQVNDVIKEVTYGTKTVADFKTAAANWKSAGGNELIDWYQKNVVDTIGTGQS